MKCPFCGALDTQVIDSRVNEDGTSIRRRRKCQSCQKRFTTYENADIRMPQIVKTHGQRQDYSRDKLAISFTKALHKRPVPTELTEASIDRIEQTLLSLGVRELPSREIGEMVMNELKRLDKVAYVRFASVYRSFSDVEDFRDVIRDLKK
jgi:transcriptional repressor NrdR